MILYYSESEDGEVSTSFIKCIMGFTCAYSKEVVNGDGMVRVPVKLRKVSYVGWRYNEKMRERVREQQSEGYETVQEITVCSKNYSKFIEGFEPEYVPKAKVVEYNLPKRPRFVKTNKQEDISNDKPQDR